MTSLPDSIRIAADVGGTFTDVIALDDHGGVWTHKLPSTPPNFEEAVLNALRHLLAKINRTGESVGEVAHGTTVAANAVLEHRGARTALITTKGFRDVLELRRMRAPQLYNLFWDKPKSLVERYLRFEINERLSATGEVLVPIDEQELWQLKEKLERERIESIGVCFLHAYAFPEHENIVGNFLRKHLPNLPVSLSSEVLRVRKEYERTATTVVNSYVRPVMGRYIDAMRSGLNSQRVTAPLLIMQSAGGLTTAADAAVRPVYVMESGPAAGVLAANYIARRLGIPNIITLDVGGTTAKASLIEDGRVAYSPEYEVGASLSAGNRLVGGGGERIIAPTIDIAEVGSGGGSVAYVDKAGGLHVGPRSAGARPGPACYQIGGKEPTLTDADVVLGYIRPGKLANGDITIDLEAAHRTIHDCIAKPLGIAVVRAAEGIHRIANSNTMRALRAVSTERGRDPRDFVLVAFGGNGPVHAANLADELRVNRTVVPPLPGLFSAVGLLFGGIEHHDARSCLLARQALTVDALQKLVEEMRQTMVIQFKSEGIPADQVDFACDMDIRFLGQASEIRLSVESMRFTPELLRTLEDGFKLEHERLYGYRSDLDNPVEVVTVRLIGRAGVHAGESRLRPAERVPNNAGIFRPLNIIAPPGTVVNGVMPAASSMRGVTGFRLVDAVFGALAQFLPDRVFAASEGGNTLVIIGGQHADRRSYVYYELLTGTWGARPDRDGNDGLCSICNIASNIPVEQAECEYPVRIQRYGLVCDSGGAGKFRGGMSVEREWTLLDGDAHLAIRSDRRDHPPYGLQGGSKGTPSNNILRHVDHDEVLPTMISTRMKTRETIYHKQPGGGGHGNPLDRAPAAVAWDVKNDKVSIEAARKQYGVALDPCTFQVNETATAALRAKAP